MDKYDFREIDREMEEQLKKVSCTCAICDTLIEIDIVDIADDDCVGVICNECAEEHFVKWEEEK